MPSDVIGVFKADLGSVSGAVVAIPDRSKECYPTEP